MADPDSDSDSRGDAHADVPSAVEAIREGELVVYPTETVYGLGADATDPDAVERVFEVKGRPREEPLSVAFADVDAALAATAASDRAERFLRAFLPGPVTVVVERGPDLPDVLTAGRERVGVRVPDHPLARSLAREAGPITATSANRSGEGSVRHADDLPPGFRDRVSVVLDAGETPGGESTVVDPQRGIIHRPGLRADEVREWLASEP